MRLHHPTPRPGNVPRVDNVQYDIGTIQHFVEFSPDALGLTLLEHLGLDFRPVINSETGRGGDLGIASPRYDSFRGVDFVVEIGGILGRGEEGGVRSRLSGSSGVGSEVVLLVEEEPGFVPSISSISKKSSSSVVLAPPAFFILFRKR